MKAYSPDKAQGDLVDSGGSWATTYGVEQDGAVLVRSDGHVAWRCRGSVTHPARVLHRALASVLGETVISVEPSIS